MKINKKCTSSINPKTGKKYSTEFKKRTVQYYLSGVYDEATIRKKFHINCTLLMQWRKWYYKHFESPFYSKPNYGKSIPQGLGEQDSRGRDKKTKNTVEGLSERGKKRKAEEAWLRNFVRDSRDRSSASGKKKWHRGVDQLRIDYPESTMEELCDVYGKSRQAWYKKKDKEQLEEYFADLIEEEVKRIRKYLPRAGGRKLYSMMTPFLKKHKIKKGRDKFIEVLRERNLMIKKKKRTRKTTNSNHHFRKHPNLIQNLQVECANQLWVSDITYIPLGRTFFYLSLVMDAYSRKIVGWHLSESLKAEGTTAALKMAIATLPRHHKGLIHHSDRGSQYCCNAYVKSLKKKHIKISMTQNGDPYENILAERINRTIKEEFINEFLFTNFKEAKLVVSKSVRYYNRKRPHASLDYLTPQQAHYLKRVLKKRWKNPIRIFKKKSA